MDDKIASLISLMAATLSEMTERAMKAEKERDEIREDARSWYRLYLEKEKLCKEKEEKLEALREYVDNLKEEQASRAKRHATKAENVVSIGERITAQKNGAKSRQTSPDEQGGPTNA